jgi:hypothetical protein
MFHCPIISYYDSECIVLRLFQFVLITLSISTFNVWYCMVWCYSRLVEWVADTRANSGSVVKWTRPLTH